MQRDEMVLAQFVESFEYMESPGAPLVPAWTGWDDVPDAAPVGIARTSEVAENLTTPELERRLSDERRRGFEAGRVRGMEEGRKEERERQAEAIQDEEEKRICQAAGWAAQFQQEQERYFRAVEPDVVRLALAVAARILRREAVSDPLLLMGAVRAALGQIAGAGEVRLRVPAADLELWSEAIALLPNLSRKPAVVAGEGMKLGQCSLEAELGTADLGLSAQLAEIERVLLGSDRLLAAGAAVEKETGSGA